jgi:hypothetical protein
MPHFECGAIDHSTTCPPAVIREAASQGKSFFNLHKSGSRSERAPPVSGAIALVMMPAAVASPYANASPGRADMRAGTNPAITSPRAHTDRTDMGTRIGSVAADTGAHANYRTNMSTGIHTVITDAGACADRTDMRAGTHTMAPDMRTYADSQDIDASAHIGNGRGRSEQDEREEGSDDDFHEGTPVEGDDVTGRSLLRSR